ncbi:M-phase inducer phosphatase 1-B,M-phase inducer phosphatase,Cdc25-like protein phosphatase twine,M-phase inducer phosphatase 1-A,M-phase inducer phosphatase 3,M-phase inducer phosphatase 1,M-phase inducer phosphatase 2 [Mytilus coruscus]|uniref:M-phase inducer phosphatase n=1 Tax=Mytilus coruscus TaxID=42192 RepID=A0A6J8E402_MYTCO|nr:M-phase inducer phosphatase 1-B,M-phase inducer phosphatase,Cdc25-like protein phosphatase twine,M-phase inducer phosphatase 1-A,M-phase inducer phosphatase 3,M-phase inducer phosphatase 1,M-phase inducer phosphatase 2 [Mytilus coruscus]
MDCSTGGNCRKIPKTPDFIKSLFDEDSGLGMDSEFDDSPTLSFFKSDFSSKRKRADKFDNNTDCDTPVSYSKKRNIRSQKLLLKKSLSFDAQILSTNKDLFVDAIKHNDTITEDVLVQGAVLTGDGKEVCCLPTVQGHCHDLRYITPTTMNHVLNGKYDFTIGSFRIIDSRYSYEFEGGHIRGAENIHNKDDILELLKNPNTSRSDGKRDIIIFHCEFSSERGPKMCRFLRNHDRELNADNYPSLYFPELYILKGGYKEFYGSYKTLCTPMNYVPMLSKDHKDDLRHFRSKSKSWYAGQKRLKSSSGRLFY